MGIVQRKLGGFHYRYCLRSLAPKRAASVCDLQTTEPYRRLSSRCCIAVSMSRAASAAGIPRRSVACWSQAFPLVPYPRAFCSRLPGIGASYAVWVCRPLFYRGDIHETDDIFHVMPQS